MAYLPFYLTPEEFQKHQESQEQEISVYTKNIEWACKNIEESNRYNAIKYTALALSPGALILAFLAYLFSDAGVISYILSATIFIVGAYAGYLSMGVDNCYLYSISQTGLVIKKQRDEPKWISKAMQVTAWICAFGCVFAVSIAGPMILAGSGILMFLAFAIMKVKPENRSTTTISLRENWQFAEYNSVRKVIVLWSMYDTLDRGGSEQKQITRSQTRGALYLFFGDKISLKKMVSFLSETASLECYPVEDYSRLFDHKRLPKEIEDLPITIGMYTIEEALERGNGSERKPMIRYMVEGQPLSESEWKEYRSTTS
ncbi:hypothetical protein ACPV5O_00355 [Vibrio maritimus]|uniref:hypothetical protein n=1 Tax=Vibrio maritimus TaxID=990268 RepID=UPI004068B76E